MLPHQSGISAEGAADVWLGVPVHSAGAVGRRPQSSGGLPRPPPRSAYLKNSILASRKKTGFGGAKEIGPLMPRIAIWNLSPGFTLSLNTTRLGMLKPWMVAGLGRPAARGICPLTQTSA